MKTTVLNLIVGLSLFGCLATAIGANNFWEQQEENRRQQQQWQNLWDNEKAVGDAVAAYNRCVRKNEDWCSFNCADARGAYRKGNIPDLGLYLMRDCSHDDQTCKRAAWQKCLDICISDKCD